MSCDECEKNSITNHELCMDCFEKEIIEAEKNGAIEELKIMKAFILFEKEKANWEDNLKFVNKRLKKLQGVKE